jgi:hypothetical protein
MGLERPNNGGLYIARTLEIPNTDFKKDIPRGIKVKRWARIGTEKKRDLKRAKFHITSCLKNCEK